MSLTDKAEDMLLKVLPVVALLMLLSTVVLFGCLAWKAFGPKGKPRWAEVSRGRYEACEYVAGGFRAPYTTVLHYADGRTQAMKGHLSIRVKRGSLCAAEQAGQAWRVVELKQE